RAVRRAPPTRGGDHRADDRYAVPGRPGLLPLLHGRRPVGRPVRDRQRGTRRTDRDLPGAPRIVDPALAEIPPRRLTARATVAAVTSDHDLDSSAVLDDPA